MYKKNDGYESEDDLSSSDEDVKFSGRSGKFSLQYFQFATKGLAELYSCDDVPAYGVDAEVQSPCRAHIRAKRQPTTVQHSGYSDDGEKEVLLAPVLSRSISGSIGGKSDSEESDNRERDKEFSGWRSPSPSS